MAEQDSGSRGAARNSDERLRQVEEDLGFTGHSLERLAEGVSDLSARLERVLARVDALERRLGRIETPPEPAGDADSSEQE